MNRQERLLKLSLGISPLPGHSTAVAQVPFHTFWAKATELDVASTSASDKILIACLLDVYKRQEDGKYGEWQTRQDKI